MSLNLDEIPTNNTNSNRPLPKSGPQPARIAQIIDLGIQTRPPFKGKEKSPVHQVFINFELVNDSFEFEGKKINHRIGSKPFNIVSRKSDMYENSAISKFLKAIDPQDKIKGELPSLANTPCLAMVVHNPGIGKHQGKTFANITQIMVAPEGVPVAALSTEPTVFSFDAPTEKAWKDTPKFLQDKIKSAINYKGSKVEALLIQMGA